MTSVLVYVVTGRIVKFTLVSYVVLTYNIPLCFIWKHTEVLICLFVLVTLGWMVFQSTGAVGGLVGISNARLGSSKTRWAVRVKLNVKSFLFFFLHKIFPALPLHFSQNI